MPSATARRDLGSRMGHDGLSRTRGDAMTDELRTQLESKSDDELIEMLRDRESGDWRPEALATAAAIITERGVALPEAAPPEDEAEFVDLVTIATFLTTG